MISSYMLFSRYDTNLPFFFRPRRKTKTLMKKDKYPLAGGLLPGDGPSGVGGRGPTPGGPNGGSQSAAAAAAAAASAAAARDMYGSMNGYMPNGYYDSMYSQSPYSSYGRYDSMSAAAMYSSAAAASSYMNGSYMSSMYPGAPVPTSQSSGQGGGSSPYGSMQSMSPVGHASHSPGSVKSENGGVAMPQDSPSCGGGGYGGVKREMTPPPPGSIGSGPPSSSSLPPPTSSSGPTQPQDLNRMISMYLPGGGPADAAAAAAAAAAAGDQRLHAMYAGHYQTMVQGASSLGGSPGAPPGLSSIPPDHLSGGPHVGPPPPAASLAHM